MREVSFTKNLVVIILSISVFVAVVMGFIIGSLIEDLAFKNTHLRVGDLVTNTLNDSDFADRKIDLFTELKNKDLFILGFNIIDQNGTIKYSDEDSLIGKTFSDKTSFMNSLNGKSSYYLDRDLISQENRPKEKFKRILVLFYTVSTNDQKFVIQIFYDISTRVTGIDKINILLWITIFSSLGVLFVTTVVMSSATSKALENTKNRLEIEVKKRTHDLEKSKLYLDKMVKERTKELEAANIGVQKKNVELVQKTVELNETKNQLEDRNYELEKANNEITELLRIKTDFLNRAAHDLRTPLTPITILVPIIKKKEKDEMLRKDLAVVENNTNYLNQLVSELITLIKTQSGTVEYEYEKIKMDKLIEDVIKNEESVFKINRIKIVKKIQSNLPPLNGDSLKLTEVLHNLISNAIKFMPKGGTLNFETLKKDNFLYVRIKDSGIGMTKKTLSRLFEPFFKADQSRHSQGSGLGLSICKTIVENHKGKIWAESKGLGKGTIITFTLPLS